MINSPTASGLAASYYAGAQLSGPTPATLAPDTFARWPVAAQVTFLKAHGQGDPRTVLIGPEGGPRSIAVLNAAGTDVGLADAPYDLDTAPSALDFETFRTWSNTAQVYYVQTRGAAAGPGAPLSVALGRVDADSPQAVATLAPATGRAAGVTLTASPAFLAATQGTVGTAPAALDAASFFGLLPGQQYDYAVAKGSGQPPTVSLAGATGAGAVTITLEAGGRTYAVKVPASAYSQLSEAATGTPPVSNVKARAFTTWPDAVQRAYVEAQAGGTTYPKLILLEGGAQFALIAAAGADVERVPVPADWAGATRAIEPATFLRWPPAAQLAFLAKQGSPLTLGSQLTPDQTLTITRATGTADGLTLTSPARPATAPADLDPALFALWPGADQAAYLKARLGAADIGALASLPVGRGTALLTLADDGSVRADAIPGDAPPAGFATAPAALAPATFMAWPPAVRAHYVRQNTPAQDPAQGLALTIGPATAPQLSATVAPDGALWLSGARPLGLETTAGMGLPNPTANIYGSAGGLAAGPNAQNAEKLFPTLDGSPGKTIADKPAALARQFAKLPADLTAAEFGGWNTAIQLEYLRLNGNGAQGFHTTIGAGDGAIHAFVSASGTKVYVVENLQKTDVGKMPLADQTVLADLPAFANRTDLNLTKWGSSGVDEALTRALAIIDGTQTTLKNGITIKGGTIDAKLQPDMQVFKDEINLLKASLDGNVLVSKTEFDTKLMDIMKRFERVKCFAASITKDADGKLIARDTKYVDTTQNSSLVNSYRVFLEQENALFKIAKNRQDLAKGATQAGVTQHLDAPNLIYLFQLYANQVGEVKIRIKSEEISQINELVKTYNVAQSMVNKITVNSDPGEKQTNKYFISGFGEGHDPDEKDRGKIELSGLSDVQKQVRWMFEQTYIHPIETLHGLTRTRDPYGAKTVGQWSTYGQQLAERVTLINQESQILMNEVNSDTKAKDRNFDLANNALSKMNEIVQKIAGAN